ncbi:hypothetical protein DVH24_035261 [Malus domestica]|uniref:Uncharacterized protein n=1 Tax=Malus domestica TaxID=3750 RepID=A0A498J750_MALDO|nr:hypothetical protein DVH24_035261 [Malus domestica]
MGDIIHPFENQMVEGISLVDEKSPSIYDEYVDDDSPSSNVCSSMVPIARALGNVEFILNFDHEVLCFLSTQKKLNPRHAKWASYKNFDGREKGSSFQEYLKEVGQYHIAHMRDDAAEVRDIKFQDIVDVKEGTIYEYIDFIGLIFLTENMTLAPKI